MILLTKQFILEQSQLFARYFQKIASGVTYIKVKDTNNAFAFMAANYYEIHHKILN
jgi:hypothetical protein